MSRAADAERRFLDEALPAFVAEAHEQGEGIEQLLLQLEAAPDDRELLDALFRCAHTVKGSAGIFGLDRVVAFTHHVETLLDRTRAGHVALTPDVSTLLLQCNDRIRALVAEATGGPAATASDAEGEALVARLRAFSGDEDAPRVGTDEPVSDAAPEDVAPYARTAAAGFDVDVRFGADTFRDGMDPLAIVEYLARLGTPCDLRFDLDAVPELDAIDPETCHVAVALRLDTDRPRDEVEAAFGFVREGATLAIEARVPAAGPSRAVPRVATDAPAAHAPADGTDDAPAAPALRPAATDARAADAPDAARRDDPRRSIRVQADRLDAVIDLMGELAIAGAGAGLLARRSGQGALIECMAQIGRLVEEIRNGTLQLRMVPIGESFVRLRRVVRDTAAQLGKDVTLEIDGGDTELDRGMVERIADPLMHLVRNALDHGLETPAERLAAGKAPTGRLRLTARHEAGGVWIGIDDDGRGISRSKVLERAWSRGIVERGTVPPDDEVLRLIFEPGFSTAERVTDLSGRGVGMDVVRRNIEALRGTVTVRSREGEGTSIGLRLPLTLAIIDGFLVGVGASRFVLPLDAVVEVIEARDAEVALDARGRGVVELRGHALPVVALRSLYDLGSTSPGRASIVVLQAGDARFGLQVDQLLGQHQTVIKPLGRMFRSLRGISGSTVLGNGDVALIVDVLALGERAAAAGTAAAPHRTGVPA